MVERFGQRIGGRVLSGVSQLYIVALVDRVIRTQVTVVGMAYLLDRRSGRSGFEKVLPPKRGQKPCVSGFGKPGHRNSIWA